MPHAASFILHSFLSTLLALSQPFTWTNICTFLSYDLCELAIETQFSPIAQCVCVCVWYTCSCCHRFQLVYAVFSLIFFYRRFCVTTQCIPAIVFVLRYTHPQAHTYTQCTRLNVGNCWFKSNSVYKCSVMVHGRCGAFFPCLFNSSPFARWHCFDKIVF